MTQYYCPDCEAVIKICERKCPNCGLELDWDDLIRPEPPDKLEVIDEPILSWYEDQLYHKHIVISIPIGKRGYPFTFGMEKAKGIVNWFEDIRDYSENCRD